MTLRGSIVGLACFKRRRAQKENLLQNNHKTSQPVSQHWAHSFFILLMYLVESRLWEATAGTNMYTHILFMLREKLLHYIRVVSSHEYLFLRHIPHFSIHSFVFSHLLSNFVFFLLLLEDAFHLYFQRKYLFLRNAMRIISFKGGFLTPSWFSHNFLLLAYIRAFGIRFHTRLACRAEIRSCTLNNHE